MGFEDVCEDMEFDSEEDMMDCYMETMPCMDVCMPSEDCMDCFEDNMDDDMMMDGDKKGKKGKKNMLLKAFEHGRPSDEEMDDMMREEGMPEPCMDVCRPDDDCMDCAMMVDWENFEDVCEDMEFDSEEDMMDCYM